MQNDLYKKLVDNVKEFLEHNGVDLEFECEFDKEPTEQELIEYFIQNYSIKKKNPCGDKNYYVTNGWDTYCSCCGESAFCDSDWGAQWFAYCPECGAKMERGFIKEKDYKKLCKEVKNG